MFAIYRPSFDISLIKEWFLIANIYIFIDSINKSTMQFILFKHPNFFIHSCFFLFAVVLMVDNISFRMWRKMVFSGVILLCPIILSLQYYKKLQFNKHLISLDNLTSKSKNSTVEITVMQTTLSSNANKRVIFDGIYISDHVFYNEI